MQFREGSGHVVHLERPETPTANELAVDTSRFFPSAFEFLALRDQERGRVSVDSKAQHLEMVARESAASAFERHIGWSFEPSRGRFKPQDEFRAGCRSSHLHVLKEVADALSIKVDQLEKLLTASL